MKISLFIIILLMSLAASAYADKSRDEIFVFPASRGDVTFNHTAHQKRLASEGCIPCHKTDKPSSFRPEKRFEARIAHYFCKGCHREMGKGPTECPQCHKPKN
jgi:hypothetical protein